MIDGAQYTILPIKSMSGTIEVAGDRAISHRALILSAVAQGEGVLTGLNTGRDCLTTAACMRKLGAKIELDGTAATVRGTKSLKNNQHLYVLGSGTTLRLLTGLVAGAGVNAYFEDEDAVIGKNLARILESLAAMGARITAVEGCPPIAVKGETLKGRTIYLGGAGAQVKGALLLAGLWAKGGITLFEDVPSRDHTEILLEQMSADLTRDDDGKLTIRPAPLKSIGMHIPGDISCAAYYMVAATILPESDIVLRALGLNPLRTCVIDVINACGGRITLMNEAMPRGERVGDVLAQYAPHLRPFNLTGVLAPHVIDELPALAVMACFTSGVSRITGARELRSRGTDRIALLCKTLSAMGGAVQELPDGMLIRGTGGLHGGVEVDCQGDYRVAMAMTLAAAASERGAVLVNASGAQENYPGFFAPLERKRQA
ncbi:MAG: 3-phosphoshikimate 1-carboxyvinyltransferase [Clostridiales bacterium]|jgi:3-phosphoshikimate 1-carboxyvinyltransferase|nr:3-phosphoshikimate 1-carboxyvinyltransferase [Clostridiales bacterium]